MGSSWSAQQDCAAAVPTGRSTKGEIMNNRYRIRIFLVVAIITLSFSVNSLAYTSGDVDNDGVVRLADALLVMRYVTNNQELSSDQIQSCNVNNDAYCDQLQDMCWANCDVFDVFLILQKAYGLMP